MHRIASSAVVPDVLGGGISGLAEPLIPKKDSSGGEEQDDDDETPIPLSSVSVIIGTVLLGGVGIAASAFAMVSMAGMIAVYVAGGLCAVNSLAVVKNQYQISKGKGYRQGINDLRNEANRLGIEVDFLTNAIYKLQDEAALMKDIENQLTDIAQRQGISVDKLVQLTKENEQILAQQKANLKQICLSDIAKAFISSEFLTDMKIDLKNLPILIMRLQIQFNSHGMELDAKKFSELVSQDNDVGSVIKQCGELFYRSNAVSGEKSSLASKPKHETRNAVVRGVKNSLSTRGIVIGSGSDSNSTDSDSDDEEAKRLFGLSRNETEPKFQSMLHRAGEREVKANAVSKFKALSAKSGRLESSPKRSHMGQQEGANSSPQKTNARKKLNAVALDTMMFPKRNRRASEDADTTSQRNNSSRSVTSNDTGIKKKLARSSSRTHNAPSRSSSKGRGPTRRISVDANASEDAGIIPRRSSRGQKSANLRRSSSMSDDNKGMTKRSESAPDTRRVSFSGRVGEGSSIGSHRSKGSSSRASSGSRQGSSLRSSFR